MTMRNLVLAASLAAWTGGRAGAQEPPPRLVVLVSVDQMVPEQLDRLEPWLEGGLGRFVRGGRVFTQSAFGHAITETAPGHAVFSTGTHPARNGVPANFWFDRELGRLRYCVEDEAVKPVRTGEVEVESGGHSPARLRVPGFVDHVKAAIPESRSVAIAGKDRSAVLLGGHGADVALWWDRGGSGFESSTWYGAALPEWVDAWNADWIGGLGGDEESAWVWEPLLADELEGSGTAEDDRPGENRFYPGGRTFPHRAPPRPDPENPSKRRGLATFTYSSPLLDRFALELAREAVVAMELGSDDATDVLAVGLSSCDTVGHSFGPRSREAADVILRADRGLGELFELLDERVGQDHWIAVLTADHGVLPLPEALVEDGIPAVRLGKELQQAFLEARQAVKDAFGDDFTRTLSTSGWFLDQAALLEAGLDAAEVRALAAESLLAAGSPWIARATPLERLLAIARGDAEGDALERLAARSFVDDASPDVFVQLAPWCLFGVSLGTSHGSSHAYDRRVPLVLLGPGFEPARRHDHGFGPVDVVPTLLDRLGLPLPDELEGRVLP